MIKPLVFVGSFSVSPSRANLFIQKRAPAPPLVSAVVLPQRSSVVSPGHGGEAAANVRLGLAASLWLPCEPLGLRDLWGSCVGRMCMPPPKSSNGQSCSADIFEAASEASRRSRFCRRCGTSALRSWWISFGPPRTAEAELEKGWVAIGERPVTPDSSKEHDGASCGGKRGLYAWGMRTYFLLLGGKMANITGLHGQTGCDCQSCLSRAVALLLFKRRSCCQDMLSYWIVLKFYSGGDVQSEIDNCRERLSSTFAF